MWQLLVSGFILGMASSLHCIGMCGPLMLALPVRHLGRVQQFTAILLYNAGRILSYSLIGLLAGVLGRSILINGFQQSLSVATGILMLVFALFYFLGKRSWKPGWLVNIYARMLDSMSFLIRSKTLAGYFLFGTVNGLLPCGMVYIAMATSLLAAGYVESMLFMMLFGIGTLPAMLAFGFFGIRIGYEARNRLKKLMPYVALGIGVLLILRGMNLGIPLISPLTAEVREGIHCH